MPGAGSIYHHETGSFVATIKDGDAAGLAAAKAVLAVGGGLQMGPGTEGIPLGAGWGIINLVRYDALGRLFISRFNITDGDDPTKVLSWLLSGIATATTRSVTVPNWSGVFLLPPDWGAVAGRVLTSNGAGTQPTFQALPAVSNALLDGVNHTDTVARAVTRGGLVVGTAGPVWDRLTVGAANTILTSDGTDVGWLAPAGVAGTIQHDLLLHLKPFSVANVNWVRGTDDLSTSGGGFANVKIGDYILLGANVTASTQGAKVTLVTDTNNITVDLTKSGGDPSDLTNVTVFVAPGDHFNDTAAVDTNGDGVGLFLTGGRGTYNTGNTSGSFQELRGPIRWRGQGQSASTLLPSDFRVATSGSAGTRSGFCFDGTPSGAAGKVYWLVSSNLGSDTTILIPDLDPSAGSDTLVFTGLAQTILSKTIQGSNTKIVMDGTTGHAVFQNGGFGDRLVHDFTGVTALRVSTHPNHDYRTVGSITSAMVNSTGNGASIGSTTLLTTPAAGVYRASVYIVVTTAGAAGTVDTTMAWNDGTAARTRTAHTAVSTAATNFEEGEVTMRADGATNISFSTTLAGGAGVAYSIYIRVEALG